MSEQLVCVSIKHRASPPGTVWVAPVDWEPRLAAFGAKVVHDEGAAWEEDDPEEVAGMAIQVASLPCEPIQGQKCEVPLRELFWLLSNTMDQDQERLAVRKKKA